MKTTNKDIEISEENSSVVSAMMSNDKELFEGIRNAFLEIMPLGIVDGDEFINDKFHKSSIEWSENAALTMMPVIKSYIGSLISTQISQIEQELREMITTSINTTQIP